MDDFRLDPISPSDAYRDRQPFGSGDRKKARQPKDQPAEERDEVVLGEFGAADSPVEGGQDAEDYYSPSDPAKESG